MSTNSSIRIKRTDGTTTGIYCHSDGYTEYNGVILQAYYNTPDKIEELLKLGDISVLGKDTSETIAYHRDRGEPLRQSLYDYEYNYTFDCYDMVWYVEWSKYKKTPGSKYLCLDYTETREKKLLIDDIINKEETVRKAWSGDPVQECKEAAYAARSEIIEKQRAEFLSYYHAYCD